ncbi:GIY-YIG nuclease family protein [Candidatus Babeliales bacterium]|nr:GIY-YIG nuclease family protein [Candidatus Babeliales bacterium]
MKTGYVYIMANRKKGTLYIGVTSNLVKRVFQHKNGKMDSFSKQYETKCLVYYEVYENNMYQAIRREKMLKKWLRSWKIDLISKKNPDWKDLYGDIIGTQ